MIALDTNVLARFLTQDDPDQGRMASKLIGGLTEQNPGFVAREVLVELVWVLERSYRYRRSEITRVLEGFCQPRSWTSRRATALVPSFSSTK